MKKDEIIRLIVERLEDHNIIEPEEEIASVKYIDLEYATSLLEDYKHDDSLIGDDDFRMPKEATPELFMEAYNCRIRLARNNVMKEAYIEWMKNAEPWDVYESYCNANNKLVSVVYTDWLDEDMGFPFPHDNADNEGELSMLDLITIGQNSSEFNRNHTYCWYDQGKNALVSTDTPFADGLINAEEIAEWLLQNPYELDMVDYNHHDTVPNCWPWED